MRGGDLETVIRRTIDEFASERSQWNAASSAGRDNVARELFRCRPGFIAISR